MLAITTFHIITGVLTLLALSCGIGAIECWEQARKLNPQKQFELEINRLYKRIKKVKDFGQMKQTQFAIEVVRYRYKQIFDPERLDKVLSVVHYDLVKHYSRVQHEHKEQISTLTIDDLIN